MASSSLTAGPGFADVLLGQTRSGRHVRGEMTRRFLAYLFTTVLALMFGQGLITQEQYDALIETLKR